MFAEVICYDKINYVDLEKDTIDYLIKFCRKYSFNPTDDINLEAKTLEYFVSFDCFSGQNLFKAKFLLKKFLESNKRTKESNLLLLYCCFHNLVTWKGILLQEDNFNIIERIYNFLWGDVIYNFYKIFTLYCNLPCSFKQDYFYSTYLLLSYTDYILFQLEKHFESDEHRCKNRQLLPRLKYNLFLHHGSVYRYYHQLFLLVGFNNLKEMESFSQKSKSYYDKAIKIEPSNPVGYQQCSLIFEQSKHVFEQIFYLFKITALSRNGGNVLNFSSEKLSKIFTDIIESSPSSFNNFFETGPQQLLKQQLSDLSSVTKTNFYLWTLKYNECFKLQGVDIGNGNFLVIQFDKFLSFDNILADLRTVEPLYIFSEKNVRMDENYFIRKFLRLKSNIAKEIVLSWLLYFMATIYNKIYFEDMMAKIYFWRKIFDKVFYSMGKYTDICAYIIIVNLEICFKSQKSITVNEVLFLFFNFLWVVLKKLKRSKDVVVIKCACMLLHWFYDFYSRLSVGEVEKLKTIIREINIYDLFKNDIYKELILVEITVPSTVYNTNYQMSVPIDAQEKFVEFDEKKYIGIYKTLYKYFMVRIQELIQNTNTKAHSLQLFDYTQYQSLIENATGDVIKVKPKYIVLDTNFLFDQTNHILFKKLLNLKNIEIIIPFIVARELKGLAKDIPEALEAKKLIKAFPFWHNLYFASYTGEKTVSFDFNTYVDVKDKNIGNNDDHIIECAFNLNNRLEVKKYKQTVLISNDRVFALKAKSQGIPVLTSKQLKEMIPF